MTDHGLPLQQKDDPDNSGVDPHAIPEELLALSIALDTGDAATTAEAAEALQALEVES